MLLCSSRAQEIPLPIRVHSPSPSSKDKLESPRLTASERTSYSPSPLTLNRRKVRCEWREDSCGRIPMPRVLPSPLHRQKHRRRPAIVRLEHRRSTFKTKRLQPYLKGASFASRCTPTSASSR